MRLQLSRGMLLTLCTPQVTAAGVVSTVAGSRSGNGFVDATGSLARFNSPRGLAFDAGTDSLYVSDYGNHAVRKINTSTYAVTTVLGTLTLQSLWGVARSRQHWNSPDQL